MMIRIMSKRFTLSIMRAIPVFIVTVALLWFVALSNAVQIAYAEEMVASSPQLTTQAAGTQTSKSVDEAISWCKSKVGSSIDYDGAYGAQCVDFIKAYYAYIGMDASKVWGNGKDYATNHCYGWSRVKGGVPQRGDILVYSNSTNGYGHVAICESEYSIYEQNYNNCHKVEHHTWKYNSGYEPGYWGYIRPNWKPSGPVEPKVTTIDDGTYLIRSAMDKVISLDVAGQSKESGANVHIWQCHNKSSQQWKFTKNSDGTYTVVNVNSGLALDVAGAGTGNGVNVQQYTPNGTNAQKWYVCDAGNSQYCLKSKVSGKYLDISGANKDNGANAIQYQYNGGANQKYNLIGYAEFGKVTTNIPDGYYSIKWAKNDSYTLDYDGGNTANNTNVQLWSSVQNDNQVFYFKRNGESYTISAKKDGSAVFDMSGCGLSLRTNVQLYNSNGTVAQKYYIRDCGNGVYGIQCVGNGMYLDVQGGVEADGTNIQSWTGAPWNGSTENREFNLVPWNRSLDGSRTTVSGVAGSYAVTGSAIVPKPTLMWQANSMRSVRVPTSGEAGHDYSNRALCGVRAGHTYVVSIGSASRIAGSAEYAQLRAVLDGLDVAVRPRIDWKTSPQTVTITPTKDSTLYIYPGIAGSAKGNAALFNNVIVRERLVEGSDYALSYANNVNVGTGSVKVTAKDGLLYTGSVAKAFKIAKKNNPLSVYGKSPSVSYAKKKARTIRASLAVGVYNAVGTVSYAKVAGSNKISIARNGNLTLAKGLKRGTYTLSVKVTASGNAYYNGTSKTASVKVRVV